MTGGLAGSVPPWYPLLAAARWLRVPPWELEAHPDGLYWQMAADAAAGAEAAARKAAARR